MTNTKNYLTSVIVVLVITLLLSIDSCAANVRGYHGVRPLVKNGGAVNPHLSNIEKQKILRIKKEMQQMEQVRVVNANAFRGAERRRNRKVF
mmetsp:Transcript_31320/g.45656  ORF Transcript_31320/g.45656 Transcript_31320/m.45656 type:complete len:92 (+) Transcript_31320:98-373(+)